MISEEQRKERIGYLGASDAAAALGLSRWKTPLALWCEKTGKVPMEDISGKLHIEIGNELEDVCARLFEKRTGKKVARVNDTIHHPKYPFLAANLDRRVVGEDAVLEIKTCGSWAAKEWEDDGVPAETIVQVLHQLACCPKMKRGYACVLIGGNQDFLIKVVERDEKLIADIIKKEVDFWTNFVVPVIMPKTITKGDAETLYKLFPTGDDGPEIALGDDANRIIESVQGLQADVKAMEAIIDKEKNLLRAMLADHTTGLTDLYKVTWKNQIANRVNVTKMKEDAPEVYDQWAEPSASRVLRIAKLKK